MLILLIPCDNAIANMKKVGLAPRGKAQKLNDLYQKAAVFVIFYEASTSSLACIASEIA